VVPPPPLLPLDEVLSVPQAASTVAPVSTASSPARCAFENPAFGNTAIPYSPLEVASSLFQLLSIVQPGFGQMQHLARK
jgi:hypothetical protein